MIVISNDDDDDDDGDDCYDMIFIHINHINLYILW